MFKSAYVVEKGNKFHIKVDNVLMTELVNYQWVTVEFDTKEEAEQELKRYIDFWK